MIVYNDMIEINRKVNNLQNYYIHFGKKIWCLGVQIEKYR